jgi:hypothetical protein
MLPEHMSTFDVVTCNAERIHEWRRAEVRSTMVP